MFASYEFDISSVDMQCVSSNWHDVFILDFFNLCISFRHINAETRNDWSLGYRAANVICECICVATISDNSRWTRKNKFYFVSWNDIGYYVILTQIKDILIIE